MSHAAVLTTCQMPCRSGCPSRVFGGVYVPEVCAATRVATRSSMANAASAISDPTTQRFTEALLLKEVCGLYASRHGTFWEFSGPPSRHFRGTSAETRRAG